MFLCSALWPQSAKNVRGTPDPIYDSVWRGAHWGRTSPCLSGTDVFEAFEIEGKTSSGPDSAIVILWINSAFCVTASYIVYNVVLITISYRLPLPLFRIIGLFGLQMTIYVSMCARILAHMRREIEKLWIKRPHIN